VVLENESGPCFDDLVTQYTQRFAPADGVEFGIVEEMAAAYWRMRRAWAIENRLMEKALRHQPPRRRGRPHRRRLCRIGRLPRIYQRALYNLALLGERVSPNETSMADSPPEPMKIDAIDPESHQVQA